MAEVIVFDVNETLLDLAALDPHFTRMFGDPALRREWFSQVLQCALVSTLTGHYHDFTRVGAAALHMLAGRYGVSLTAADSNAIAATMRHLPPHPEVPAALATLSSGGRRLAALTNSPPSVMSEQLAHAGLAVFFERQLSVERVHRLKPALEIYHNTARELGVKPPAMMMVSAHGWDLAGAISAGCATAFVARAGQVLDPLYPAPQIIGADLREVADQILRSEA